MRATGIIRRLDDLGRVVIPKEIRRTMGVREGDPLEMYVEENGGLVLIPYHSEASSKLRGIAETISNIGMTPEYWEIADEIRAIANKLKNLEENT
jgi:AbrB family transcriptional regulator (stage V sporulation protein T)